MRSSLVKSLMIDFLFTSICLSHGDNPRDVVAAWRVGNDDYSAGEYAQGEKPLLSIIEAAICEGHAWAGQHLFRVRKIQPMFSEVAAVLRFVLFVYQYIIL